MRMIALLIFLLVSCGSPVQKTETPINPQPTPTRTPNPDGKTSFSEAQSIMKEYCAECHATAGFIKSEAGLLASSAKSRVQNSSMPPPYATQMDAADKQKFLNFF